MLGQETTPQRRRGIALSLFVLFLGLYLLTAGEGFSSNDGEMLFETTWNLATRGTMAISCDSGIPGRDGLCFSSYGLAMPVASLPLAWMGEAANNLVLHGDELAAARLFVARFNQIITALGAVVVFHWGWRLYRDTLIATALTLIYGAATLAWPYAKFHFGEPLTALGLVSGSYFLYAYRQTGNGRLLWWGGLGLAAAALTQTTAALCFLPALLYLEAALRTVSQTGDADRQTVWKDRISFWGPLLVALVLMALYNWYRFNSIVDFGYPDKAWATSLPTGLFGLLISPGKGLFWYTPVAILALWGLVNLYHRQRSEALLFFAFFAGFLFWYAGYRAWGGGDCWGPRYLVPVIPFLVLSLGTFLVDPDGVWTLTVFVGVSVLIQILGVSVDFNYHIAATPDEELRLFAWRYTPLLHHARYLLAGEGANFLGRELWALGLPRNSPIIWRLVWGLVVTLAGAVLSGLLRRVRLREVGARMLHGIRARISEPRGIVLGLAALLIVAGLLRGYDAMALMRFTGDEARDLLLARDITARSTWPLLGPKIHRGYGFLGPAYAYLMALPLKLANDDPGVAVCLTILADLGAILLVYVLGKELFGRAAGLFAATLYTLSFTMVFHARWCWHPSLVPFCTLLIVHCMLKVQRGRVGYSVPLMGCLGLALQFHISLVLLFIPLVVVFWGARKAFSTRVVAWSLIAFALVTGPLLFHELTTGFQNSREMLGVFSAVAGGEIEPFLPYLFDSLQVVADQAFHPYGKRQILLDGWRWMYWINVVLVFAGVGYGVRALRHKPGRLLLVLCWAVLPPLALAAFTGTRLHYYLLLWFPLPLLLVGALLGRLASSPWGRPLALGLMILLALTNIATYGSYLGLLRQDSYSYFHSSPLQDKKDAIDTVVAASEGNPFDLVVVSWHWNNHLPYAYLLANRQPYPRAMQVLVLDSDTGTYTRHDIDMSDSFPPHSPPRFALQTYAIVEPASLIGLEDAVVVSDVGHIRIYRLTDGNHMP